MPDQKKYWTLYGKVRAAQRQGASYDDINKEIRRVTGGKIAGIASLEKELGVGDEKGRGEKLRESVANIADKALLGYGGELRGALRGGAAALTGGDFKDTYAAEQMKFDVLAGGAKETSPLAAGIGTAAGFAVPGIMGAAVAPARAGTVAARASAPLRAQVLGGAVRGAGAGALGGALEGASTPGDRVGGAVRGGALGSLFGMGLGGGIPLVGAGIGFGASKLSQALPTAERKATGLLGRALERAGVKPSRLPEAMAELPEGSRVGDISGSLRRSARATRNVASHLEDPAVGESTSVLDDIVAREHGRGQRVATGLRREADLPRGYDPEKVFQQHRSRWLREHVEPLYPERVPLEGLGEGLAENGQWRAALSRSGLDPDALPPEAEFKKLWAARQELKRQIGDHELNQFEREQADNAVAALEGFLDERVPGARKVFSEYARIKDVEELYDVGRKLGAGDATLDLERAIEQAGDDPEKLLGLRQGLVSWFEGKLLRKGTGGSVAQDLMQLPPRTREQLRVLFGKDKLTELEAFITDELQGRELRWSKLTTALRGNSSTPMQLADMQELLGSTKGPTFRDLYNRIWTAAMTNVDFSRDVAYEYGKLLLSELDDAAIRRITDTMVELAQSQTALTARGLAPAGAAASEFGPGLFEKKDSTERKTTIF